MDNALKILLFTGLVFCGLIFPQKKNFYEARDSISGQAIYRHLSVLADDSLEGRGTGSRGSELASGYIAENFSRAGLEKIVPGNSWFQEIPMHGSLPLPSSELTLVTNDDTIHLSYSNDYFLYRSGQQTFIPVPLEIVFVGYGIVAPEFDYNDYQAIDVEGKIAVFIDGEPESGNDEYFNGATPSIYSYAESKRRIAVSRGAAGTIQIPVMQYADWSSVQKDFETEDITLAYSVSGGLSVVINPVTAARLFNNAAYSLEQVIEMHLHNKMRSFVLEPKLKFRGVFKERDFIGRNVIGMLTGSDPVLKNSYILISSHYDHLGIGFPVRNDSVYNGALDNAIGVSVMLEIAEAFSKLDIKPKRSLIFIATTGEEKGLLGSGYYTDNPVVPLYQTAANVNIDGIAFFRDFTSIVAVGEEYSDIGEFLERTAEKYNFTIEDIPGQFRQYDSFSKSDQFSFASAGIPSVLVLEGTKNKTKSAEEVEAKFIDYFINRYHTPFDDLNQDIDPGAAEKHAKILFDFCYTLASDVKAPEWKSGSPFLNARLRSAAERR